MKVGNNISAMLILNTGAPQWCMLSPLLYSMFTHDCVTTHASNSIIKFADDTIVVGLITNTGHHWTLPISHCVFKFCILAIVDCNNSTTVHCILVTCFIHHIFIYILDSWHSSLIYLLLYITFLVYLVVILLVNIQCIRKVFRPLHFFHILLRYRLILKWINSFFPPQQSTHNSPQWQSKSKFLENVANV